VVHEVVVSDPENPRSEWTIRVERVERLERFEEHVLREVFRNLALEPGPIPKIRVDAILELFVAREEGSAGGITTGHKRRRVPGHAYAPAALMLPEIQALGKQESAQQPLY
jgi:hypothetical protein